MKRITLSLLIAQLIVALIGGPAWADFPGSPIGGGSSSGTATAVTDNIVGPIDMKYTGTPDNTMYPRWKSSTEFEWATPTGTDNASALTTGTVAVARGGTGSDNAAGARTNLGLVIGTNVLAPSGNGSSLTGLTSGQVSGLGTMATQAATAVNIDGGTIDNTVIGGTTPAAGTFTTIIFDTATSTCIPSDNNCGQTANNTGDPTGANLSAGLQWLNTTTNLFKVRNGDNTATLTMLDKSVKFTKEWGCDNVVLALDNNSIVFPAGFAQAVTIDNIMARVSTDNAGFQLKHCAPDNVSSCTYINDELLATNGAGMTSTATFTDATIPAGRPVLIEFTTVGTSNSNRFYMGVRYSVD